MRLAAAERPEIFQRDGKAVPYILCLYRSKECPRVTWRWFLPLPKRKQESSWPWKIVF